MNATAIDHLGKCNLIKAVQMDKGLNQSTDFSKPMI